MEVVTDIQLSKLDLEVLIKAVNVAQVQVETAHIVIDLRDRLQASYDAITGEATGEPAAKADGKAEPE